MNAESKAGAASIPEQQGARISEQKLRNRHRIKRVVDTLLFPLMRHEMVNPENLDAIGNLLDQGTPVLVLSTHPGQKETLGFYDVTFGHDQIVNYEMEMTIARHQQGKLIQWMADRSQVTFDYIVTPETVRKFEKKHGHDAENKPVLYEGTSGMTTSIMGLLRRGGLVGIFPQGSRSSQLEPEDDMKALSRLSTVAHKRHGIDFAVAFWGIEVVGAKNEQDYRKARGLKSFLKRNRYTFGEPRMISDILNDPDVAGDYRKLDAKVYVELGKLVGEAYRGDFNPASVPSETS